MRFTAVTIVAPNVPDGADPLTYLTVKPRDKAQELAQQQAQALALARFHGSTELVAAISQDDVQEPTASVPAAAATPRRPSLTPEEKQAVQEKKTCRIPPAAPAPLKGSTSQNLDYPYLYPQMKVRTTPQLLGADTVAPTELLPQRTSSVFASTPAPVLRPTLEEFHQPYQFMQRAASEFGSYGLVRVVPPQGYRRDRIPFGQDISGFKTEKQIFMQPDDATHFDMHAVRKGFFRAILRFHATATVDKGKRRLQKLPTFDRRPVDLYRLFRSVRIRGGLEEVVKRKEWAQIGRELGYASQTLPTLSSTLRQAYTRAIQPFEAFLEENGVELSPHTIPRLEVEDEARPAKPREGVRVLPNGIIVDALGDNVAKEREIVVLDESRKQGPSYTLKSFRQKGNVMPLAEADASIEEKEARYWQLPAFFETEQLARRPGVLLFPFPEPVVTTTPYDYGLRISQDAWKLSDLPFHGDGLAKHVHEDIDDLVVPRLHVGHQFATQEWATAPMSAFTVHSLVEGGARTWYTDKGVFADQECGELVIVFSNMRTLNWCHTYSVLESVNLFPWFDWLEQALQPEHMNRKMRFCIQRLVYEAAKATLDKKVRARIIAAAETLRERELTVLSKTTAMKRSPAAPQSASIVCSATGAKRFFSWLLVDGKPWSPEAYFQQMPKHDEVEFITRYSDVVIFFDDLIQGEAQKTNVHEQWNTSTRNCLADAKLPTEAALVSLAEQAPQTLDSQQTAHHLRMAVENMHAWLILLQPGSQIKPLEDVRQQFNQGVGVLDNQGSVESAQQHLAAEMLNAQLIWGEVINAISNGQKPDESLVSRLEPLMPYYPQMRPFLGHVNKALDWIHAVLRKIKKLPLDCSALMSLKEQGKNLFAAAGTAAMRAIEERLQWGIEKASEVERFVLERRAFDSVAIREYQRTIDMSSLEPQTRERFRLLVMHLELIDRMAKSDLSQRPKQLEAAVLQTIPAFTHAVNNLNAWLLQAQSLDWLLIIGQIQKMSSNTAGGSVEQRISTSQLFSVCAEMYNLQIVPDDIMLVQRTIENAAEMLKATPPQVRVAYGFD